MEERLQKVLDFANYKQTLNNQLHKLKIKAEGMLMFSEAGGQFVVDPQLMCYVNYLIQIGQTETILLDKNKSPIQIKDTADFLRKISSRYFEVTNDYYREAQVVKKARNVKSILDLKDE